MYLHVHPDQIGSLDVNPLPIYKSSPRPCHIWRDVAHQSGRVNGPPRPRKKLASQLCWAERDNKVYRWGGALSPAYCGDHPTGLHCDPTQGDSQDHPTVLLCDHPQGDSQDHPKVLHCDHPQGGTQDHPTVLLCDHPQGDFQVIPQCCTVIILRGASYLDILRHFSDLQ